MVNEALDIDEPQVDEEPARPELPAVYGVFSTVQAIMIGTGTTKRKTTSRSMWFAQELDDGTVELQVLSDNNVPTGPKTRIERQDFLDYYDPEPEFYQNKVFPVMRELDTTIRRAEGSRQKGALYSAEFDFEQALDIDSLNIRANFGLGLTYLEMGKYDKACDIFKRLVGLEATFAAEHKHLFNEFGISLRKAKLVDQAVNYYERALELAEEDEHLHYNVARAHFERGDDKECREHLNKALDINDQFDEGLRFMEFLDRKEGQPATRPRPAPSDEPQPRPSSSSQTGSDEPEDVDPMTGKKCYIFDL